MHRRAMLQWLRGELPSPWGDRVYLYRPHEPDEADARRGEVPYTEHAFMHPGKWRVYTDDGAAAKNHPSAEAILDDGWLVS